ncbi:glycosyltransferase [Frankia casuarinae]|uniref:Glycosyl transferase, group 1 n=1 Tax=Frankia casuarinae (strain DSM 45818 / CECT 9043 / HFP020203 / CcI3) TaxID=106370 RepID=Q2J7M5_FRACC|nr:MULTISPECIES: glycosyltransferase family 4 protein [Frankia]ABD12717.1 glycosyl transferase, group 1 [Frankia casuarinae]ETA00475.1 glycosyltransferase [Frankia sp. CcI6]EYT91008.1 glycosyltransferase [Frankia casuarinae]KFB03766.1 glycosyltransferase [Frankia sp. Allo2]OAA20293.1 glycosyltransferase [Frankia casuarinae]
MTTRTTGPRQAAAGPDGGSPPHVLRLTPYYFLADRELTHRELQYEPIGGMQVQIMQTTEQMSALGVRQSVLLPRRPGMPRSLMLDPRTRLELLTLPVAPIPTRSKGYIGLLVSWGLAVVVACVGKRLRGTRRQYSLIHVHCSELPWTFLFAVLARLLLGRPLVLTVHCSAIATFHPETPLGWVLIGPARFFERHAVRRADAVVVLTDRVRRAYLERGLTGPDRVHVVTDGVHLADFQRPGAEAPSEPPSEPPVVLYCGRFAPEKGWADFVDAAALIVAKGVPARFVMCGDGNELERCRARARRLGIADRIELPGHLDRSRLPDVVREAAVVVIPSRHEEMGGTVIEAMAAGRPVVVTDVGGLPTVVGHGMAGIIVPPCDPPALAEAVAELLDSPQRCARLGAAGAHRARQFDQESVTRRLLDVYRLVLAHSRG